MPSKPLLLIAAIVATALMSFWAGRFSAGGSHRVRKELGAASEPQSSAGQASGSPSALKAPWEIGPASKELRPPTAAVSLSDPSVTLTFQTINDRITAMGGDEMEALFNALRTTNNHPQQGLIESLLTVHLIARAPANMIAIKLAHPNLPVLGRTYQQWGQANPEAALAHIEAMENETWYRAGLNAIFSGMGKANPERALAALMATPDLGGRHYGSLFGAWTIRSPAAATTALDRVAVEHRGQALVSIANRYPEVDPAAARRWFGSLSESDAAMARPTFEGRMRQLEEPTDPAHN